MRPYLSTILLLHHILTGVEGTPLRVYANVDGSVSLPCGHGDAPPECTWWFCGSSCYQHLLLVKDGEVRQDSQRSARSSVDSNCTLRLSRLRPGDAGMYFCNRSESPETTVNVYLSLLVVSTASPLSQLKPGGRLALGCLLHTFHDPWNCLSHNPNRSFILGWGLGRHGAPLPHHPSFGTLTSPCNVTLLVTLPEKDEEGAGLDMSWRCQVTGSGAVESFLDVSAVFLLGGPPTAPVVEAERCVWVWDHLVPASRMVLFCAAMLAAAGAAIHLACRRLRGRRSPWVSADV